MSRYCAKCDSVILGDAEHDCLIEAWTVTEIGLLHNATWNAAIEAAANVDALGMNEYLAETIRKLKK